MTQEHKPTLYGDTETTHTEPFDSIERVFQNERLELFTGTANPTLAHEIAEILKLEVDQPITIFNDNERRATITHNLQRRDVFVIQPTCPPFVNDYLMELLVTIDAVRRKSAAEITAIIPYFGYSRQDRDDPPGSSISARLVANMIVVAGANRLVTFDLHADQEKGFIDIPWKNLYGSDVLVPAIKRHNLSDTVVLSPDLGAVKRARAYAALLGTSKLAIVYKEKDILLGSSEALLMIGNVEDCDVVIVDDILAGGSTILKAADLAKSRGAKRIVGAVTHGQFLDDSLAKLDNSPIKKVITTDTHSHRQEVLDHPKIEVVSVAPLLAETIHRIHLGEDLNGILA